jgi:TldD protein
MKSGYLFSLALLAILSVFPVERVAADPASGKAPAKADRNSPAAGSETKNDALLATLEKELHRGQAELAKQSPAPYFTSYNVTDGDVMVVMGAQGGVLSATRGRRRTVDVSMRIGKPGLDNTHDTDRSSGITTGPLPIQDDPDAIARTLWLLTYTEYRKARQAYSNVETKAAVRAKDEDDSPDFSVEKPSSYIQKPISTELPDEKAWEDLARQYSAAFRRYQIEESLVYLYGEKDRSYLISTEGTQVVTSDIIFRIMIEGQVLANDGMQLERV